MRPFRVLSASGAGGGGRGLSTKVLTNPQPQTLNPKPYDCMRGFRSPAAKVTQGKIDLDLPLAEYNDSLLKSWLATPGPNPELPIPLK